RRRGSRTSRRARRAGSPSTCRTRTTCAAPTTACTHVSGRTWCQPSCNAWRCPASTCARGCSPIRSWGPRSGSVPVVPGARRCRTKRCRSSPSPTSPRSSWRAARQQPRPSKATARARCRTSSSGCRGWPTRYPPSRRWRWIRSWSATTAPWCSTSRCAWHRGASSRSRRFAGCDRSAIWSGPSDLPRARGLRFAHVDATDELRRRRRLMSDDAVAPVRLTGDDVAVPCIDGTERRYVSLDAAASTSAFAAVATRVAEFLPRYSSVHRGAGWKSQLATAEYEEARAAALRFAGREGSDDVAILCRNTTEAINHLAYRLRFAPDDVVVTTVVEHHANLLPWARVARRRHVECDGHGRFDVDDVVARLDERPRPRLLAVTGASNVTGWLPPVEEIVAAAHERDIPVLVDAAQLAPHRPLPRDADYLAWSGHKMYAPFGTGVLVGPRSSFTSGDPFLAGGGAVDLVDLDEVVWTDPPDREEAGSPNVVGAVALHAAIDEFDRIGWDTIVAHDRAVAA